MQLQHSDDDSKKQSLESNPEALQPSKSGSLPPEFADTIAPGDSRDLEDTVGADASNIPKSAVEGTRSVLSETVDLSSQIGPGDTGATCDFVFDVDTTQVLNSGVGEPQKSGRMMPKLIGGYEVRKILGRGGMGIVYQAKQKKLDRIVALKMVLAGSHASSEQLQRFISEAKAVGHLQHPNIVQIFEVGEHENLPFFTLEFVDGDSLDKQLAGKPLTPVVAARLLEKLSRAMQYAHDNGILHRDLKPANVLMCKDGTPKITDFGLAKRLEDADDSASTRTGTIMGTPSYMSPEQASGSVHELGPATDQYSLGAMLYEFLTGRPPFLAAKPFETIIKVLHEEPVPPRQLQSTLPADLETICLKALQKEPEKRYASCIDLADDLARFSRGEPILARPIGNAERCWRWCKRNPVVASLMATAAACILAVAIISSWFAVTVRENNLELAGKNESLKTLNANLEKTNVDLKESNDEKQRRSERLQSYVQEVFTETNRLNIQDNPRAKDYKNEILNKTLPLIDEIRGELPKGSQAEATMMSALQQLGKSYADQDKTIEAEKTRSMLVDMARGRLVVQEGSDKSRQNLVSTLLDLSDTRMEMNRNLNSSLELLNEALAISQAIVDAPKAAATGLGQNPVYLSKLVLANAHLKLGTLLYRKGNSLAARPHYEATTRLCQETLPSLVDGSAFENMPPSTKTMTAADKKNAVLLVQESIKTADLANASVLFRLNEVELAEPIFQTVINRSSAELKANPDNASVLRRVVGTLGIWGEFLAQTNRLEQALAALREAAEYSDKMLQINSESAELNRGAATVFYRYAQWLPESTSPKLSAEEAAKLAEEYGQKSLTIRQAMATAEPTNDRRQIALMISSSRFGALSVATAIADKYVAAENPDSEMLIEIAQAYAQCSARATVENRVEFERKALNTIQKAVDQGLRDCTLLERDIDLKPLRESPDFQSLLKALKTRVKQ